MGSIFPRGNRLWLKYRDEAGRWRAASSGYSVGQDCEAQRVLDAIEKRIAAGESHDDGATTVRAYSETWLTDREKRGLVTVCDDRVRLKLHVLPTLGAMALADVKPRHIQKLVHRLTAEKKAARTVLAIYALMHRFFGDAMADEKIPATPCVVKAGDLPVEADKNPAWRATAVFERREVETILGCDAIPLCRRVVYALGFLGGLRVGEIAALHWRDYDAEQKPLGRLSVHSSYNRRLDIEKCTKTNVARLVPVHPLLARLLDEWRDKGWPREHCRIPDANALLVPTARGLHLRSNHLLDEWHADLKALGLRQRRFHDSRRSMITLAIADGARGDVLRRVTHAGPGDVFSQYQSLPWATLCAAIAVIRITLRPTCEVIPMRAAVGNLGTFLVQSENCSCDIDTLERIGAGGGS